MFLLLAFLGVRFGGALSVPFIGDDYVFLDRTRDARPSQLWSLANTDFGWFRPWSRDVHFWILQKAFGPNELAFRCASLLLWAAGLLTYQRLLRQIGGARLAWLGTLGVVALQLWSVPLVWISGVQDLWMIALGLGGLLAFTRGRDWLALLLLGLALLSKETAVVFPLIALAYLVILRRAGWTECARRIGPMIALTLAWVCVHPTLLARLLAPAPAHFGTDPRPSPIAVAVHTLLASFNLDFFGRRLDWRSVDLLRLTLAMGLLIAATLRVARMPAGAAPSPPASTGSLAGFGAVWAIAGWSPLLQPSIGWHAYYGGLGAMGAWFALGALLERRARTAAGVLAALCILHLPASATADWDWGSEWYQRRAGNMLQLIRSQLMAQYPTLPRHSRVYFGSIPNNIGLVAGQSPAVRVWYRDSTLEAGFYSYYRPRPSDRPAGLDLFFHFDTTAGLQQVHAGPEDVLHAASEDPDWARNHESLAMTFLTHGSPAEAAVEFEKIAQLPDRPDGLGYAAICWEVAGQPERSAPLLREFSRRTGGTPEEVAAWAQRLRESLPRP